MRHHSAITRQNAVLGTDCLCLSLGHVGNLHLLVVKVPGVHDGAVEPQPNERTRLVELRIIKLARNHVLLQVTSDDRRN